MSQEQIHKAQASILHSLRYSPAERFSELMKPTGQTSDTFKFHIRKLIKLGLVEKQENGEYILTAHGKEYANSLNEPLRLIKKQPLLSVLAMVSKPFGDEVKYLVQKRQRNPFYGYWSEIHGRAEWGVPFEDIAKHQLKRQAGIDANFSVKAFRRVRDFNKYSEDILEDKLFVITTASDISGEITNNYSGGINAWLSLKELQARDRVFKSTINIIEDIEKGRLYQAQDLLYDPKDY